MKKRLTAILLTLCLVLSLAACASRESGEQSSQAQEATAEQSGEAPSQEESDAALQGADETGNEGSAESEDSGSGDALAGVTDEAEAELLAKMTDEEREQYEEFKKRHEEIHASAEAEINEYGITDESLQALADAVKENVTNDYLNIYDISTADFSWPETESTFWNVSSSVITLALNVGSFKSLPEDLFSKLSDEEKALAKALLSGIAEWEDSGDGRFLSIFNALSDENGWSAEKIAQFFTDHVTLE